MGSFMLAFIFLGLILISVLLGIVAIFVRSKAIGWILLVFWGFFFIATAAYAGIMIWAADMDVDKDTIYGEYVIDRTKFAGKQADWQYDHYRFELTKDGKIFFHVTDKRRIVKTDTGRISFVESYHHPHLKISMPQPAHDVIDSIPALHVGRSSFYYVFASKYYRNMFFTKGKWEPGDE